MRAKTTGWTGPTGAGRPSAKRQGLHCALQVRILLHPLLPRRVEPRSHEDHEAVLFPPRAVCDSRRRSEGMGNDGQPLRVLRDFVVRESSERRKSWPHRCGAPAWNAGRRGRPRHAGSNPAASVVHDVAEWRGAGLQSRGRGFDSRRRVGDVRRKRWPHWRGAPDLKSGRPAMAGRAGSNPAASVTSKDVEALTPPVRGTGLEIRRACGP